MGYTLTVIGCGVMGFAVLSGVLDNLDSGIDAENLPERVIATVGWEAEAEQLRTRFKAVKGGSRVEVRAGKGANEAAVKEADVVILSSKPYLAKPILSDQGTSSALAGKVLISICAGIRVSQLASWVPESVTVVRAMPNTPCKVREGMTVLTPISDSTISSRLNAIFSAGGRVRSLEEKHFDACTSMTGSGPAFVLMVLEAMADGGVMMGLPRADALEMAAQTILGTGKMAQQALSEGVHPAQLKDSVTTPGGTTIAGLLKMEDGGVRSAISRAVQAAAERAVEMGKAAN